MAGLAEYKPHLFPFEGMAETIAALAGGPYPEG